MQFITAEQLAGSGVKAAQPPKPENTSNKPTQAVKRRKMTDEEIMAKLSMFINLKPLLGLTIVLNLKYTQPFRIYRFFQPAVDTKSAWIMSIKLTK